MKEGDVNKSVNIISAVCDEANESGYAHHPRIVAKDDFDLSKFKEQESGHEGVKTEWVNQSGSGVCGDDFTGTLAVPIGGGLLFVVDYVT